MRSTVAALLAVAWVTTAAAVQTTLDPPAINEAIAIGQSRIERDRAQFHAPYRLFVNRPPVDHVDVITPFRHVALFAQARAQIGDRSFGQRQAFEVARAVDMQIDVRVEFTFHPLHVYVGVPAYTITLADRSGMRAQPRSVERQPRYGPRVEGLPLPQPGAGGTRIPGGGEPMLGGIVIAQFDARRLNPSGVYDVIVEEEGKQLARVRADLAIMR